MFFQHGCGSQCGSGGTLAMADAVDDRQEQAILHIFQHMNISRLALPFDSGRGDSKLHKAHFSGRSCRHFFTVTFVPWPGAEEISNSSIKRRTPGSPRPKLPEVENPSRSAWRISAMPGP